MTFSSFSTSTNEEYSPLFVASYRGNVGVAKLLLASGAHDDRAIYAAVEHSWFPSEGNLFPGRENKIEIARILLEHGYEPGVS